MLPLRQQSRRGWELMSVSPEAQSEINVLVDASLVCTWIAYFNLWASVIGRRPLRPSSDTTPNNDENMFAEG